ncbi:MAG TPA: hypothetical protein DDW52_17035, partial [Planctomycetaceae bacterium]|nr:hypothetical protein [Planctomycetaceae bacterium]
IKLLEAEPSAAEREHGGLFLKIARRHRYAELARYAKPANKRNQPDKLGRNGKNRGFLHAATRYLIQGPLILR